MEKDPDKESRTIKGARQRAILASLQGQDPCGSDEEQAEGVFCQKNHTVVGPELALVSGGTAHIGHKEGADPKKPAEKIPERSPMITRKAGDALFPEPGIPDTRGFPLP